MFPRFRSRANQRILRQFTQGPQGGPSSLWAPHCRPGVRGIFLTSCGQATHCWPMDHLSMVIGFPIPWGCGMVPRAAQCTLNPFCNPAMPLSAVPPPGPAPFYLPGSPILIVCLYPTGPPATLWRGPEGLVSASHTSCPFYDIFAFRHLPGGPALAYCVCLYPTGPLRADALVASPAPARRVTCLPLSWASPCSLGPFRYLCPCTPSLTTLRVSELLTSPCASRLPLVFFPPLPTAPLRVSSLIRFFLQFVFGVVRLFFFVLFFWSCPHPLFC